MVHLHKHTNGTFFLFTESGYYTLIKQSENPGAKFAISDLVFWREIKGPVPMGDCLAIKPTSVPEIYMFMQANLVVPISFEDNKIV